METWKETGTVSEVVQHEGTCRPISYLVKSETGSEMLYNGKYLRLPSEQPEKEGGSSLASEESNAGRKVRFSEDIEQDGRGSVQKRRSPRNHGGDN